MGTLAFGILTNKISLVQIAELSPMHSYITHIKLK